MGHHCCSKQKVKRGLWSPEEDEKLITQVTTHGHGCWSSVPRLAGLQRCGKSCRLRWINYLRPDLKRGSFSAEEEQIIIDVHRILGNRWAQIAKHLPGRTDNEVKNFWNSCIKKKMMAQGLDPRTHNLISSHYITTSNNTACNLHQQPTSVLSVSSHEMRVASMDPFITLPPPAPPSHEFMTLPPIYEEYQNPNLASMDLASTRSSMENSRAISSSMNPSGFGFLDGNCMFVEPFEHPIQEEMQPPQQDQYQQQKVCEVEFDKTTELKGGQDMDVSFNTSNFDLEFVDSTLMPCGMYCNESSMDQLSWDC